MVSGALFDWSPILSLSPSLLFLFSHISIVSSLFLSPGIFLFLLLICVLSPVLTLVTYSISKFPTYVRGLFVMAALALCIRDFGVATQALDKLRKMDSGVHSVQLYQLLCYSAVLQVSKSGGREERAKRGEEEQVAARTLMPFLVLFVFHSTHHSLSFFPFIPSTTGPPRASPTVPVQSCTPVSCQTESLEPPRSSHTGTLSFCGKSLQYLPQPSNHLGHPPPWTLAPTFGPALWSRVHRNNREGGDHTATKRADKIPGIFWKIRGIFRALFVRRTACCVFYPALAP